MLLQSIAAVKLSCRIDIKFVQLLYVPNDQAIPCPERPCLLQMSIKLDGYEMMAFVVKMRKKTTPF